MLAPTIAPAAASAGGRVYVANEGTSAVSQFRIGAGGLLAPLAPASVASGSGPTFGIAISPDGRSLFVPNTGERSVSQYDVNPATGALSAKSPATVASGDNPEGIAITPDGRSAYVASAGPSGDLALYDVDRATGRLTPKRIPRLGLSSTPADVSISPDGRSAYVSSFFNVIFQFDIDRTTGALSPKRPASITAPSVSGFPEIALTRDGRTAYIPQSSAIGQYDVDRRNGALSSQPVATVPSGFDPVGVTLGPDERSAYVPDLGYGNTPNTVSQYSIDPRTKRLTPKVPATVLAGQGPSAVAIAPNGRHAYVTNQLSRDVTEYSVDRATGRLSKTGAVATGGGVIAIVATPGPRSRARDRCIAERARIGRAAFRRKYGEGPLHRDAMRRCIVRHR